MPERRPLTFATLSDAVADARRLSESGYERAGNWNLAQVLDHLNKTLAMAVSPYPRPVPALFRPLLRWLIYRRMKRGDVIRFRASAPSSLQPDEQLDELQVLAEFERLCALLENDTTQLVPLHPFFGAFTTEDWRIMQRWHAAHHLSFLVPPTSPGTTADSQ